jgi:hypothetical protein
MSAWDASVAVLLDAGAVAAHPELEDGPAEKSADPVLDGLARDAMQLEPRVAPASAAELCRPAAVQFAERSCAAAELLVAQAWSEPLTWAQLAGLRSPQAVPLARKSRALWSSAPEEVELLAVEAVLPKGQPQLAAHSSPQVEPVAQRELPVA